MKEKETLEFVSGYQSYRPKANKRFLFWVALAVHTIVISGMIVVPLTQVGPDLPEFESMATFLARPPAPPPPPPSPPPSSRRKARPKPPRAVVREARFVVPVAMPDFIPEGDFGPVDFRVPGGVEGGIPGGVIGAVVGRLPPEPADDAPAEAVRLAFGKQEARPIVRVKPVHPELATQARVQGVVILEVLVDTTGVPSQLNVFRTVPLLEEAAEDAVEQWRWNPYVVAGKAVPFWVTVTVTFRLT